MNSRDDIRFTSSIRCFTLFMFISFISTIVYGQAQPGIYFVNKPLKKNFCEQKIKTLVGKKPMCISKKPIIGIEEIEYVSDILYDHAAKVNYISIGLSSAGVSTLNKVSQSMPGAQLALVLDNNVLGRFTVEREITSRNMFLGKDLDLNNLKAAYAILKKYKLGTNK